MNELLSEAIGTFVLVLFGCGLNAGLSLNKSYSNKEGNSWSVGTFGWGLAVTLGVYASQYSGAHINPAVTIGLLSSGEIYFTRCSIHYWSMSRCFFSLYCNLYSLLTALVCY